MYAGAIMVLFLFVIMLLNVGRADTKDLPGWLGHVLMLAIGGVLAIELWAMTTDRPGRRYPAARGYAAATERPAGRRSGHQRTSVQRVPGSVRDNIGAAPGGCGWGCRAREEEALATHDDSGILSSSDPR